ncbi:MAG: HDIG domain-containing protein [Phycisphaerales bacterium]
MVFGHPSSRLARTGRRTRIRRKLPRPTSAGIAWLRDESNLRAVLVAVAFVVAATAVITWSREVPRYYPGQLVATSRVNRLEYRNTNEQATAKRREDASKAAPRVYSVSGAYVERMRAAIEGLPLLLRGKASFTEIQPAIVERYGLTPELLEEFQSQDAGGELSSWKRWTDRYLRQLVVAVPIVASAEFDPYSTAVKRLVVVPADVSIPGDRAHAIPLGRSAIELRADDPGAMRTRLVAEAQDAGFPVELARLVAAPIVADPKPTIEFDDDATRAAAAEAALSVQPIVEVHPRGEALFVAGDILSTEQVEQVREEQARFYDTRSAMETVAGMLATAGLAAVFALLVGTLTSLYDRAIFRDWRRFAGVFALVLLPVLLASPASAYFPRATVFSSIGASLLATGVLSIVYGMRISVFAVILQAALLTLAVGTGPSVFLADVLACTVFALALRDVRQRSTLVVAAVAAAIAAGAAILISGLWTGAGSSDALNFIVGEALSALATAFFAGFLIIGLLPTIERLYGVTTGLTLAELRDPKQPLLRELQRRAPGTWNHSLQVANIAEAAAETVGADGLLTYVGALYHDIGKMNKPEYFVENQTGLNRHERLSPAMSLLVIVGHVKDGMELAAEYSLPKQVRHFIESHHGTTLMEYFFHAARKRAGEDEINEADFRYPGPKPRTREAAILMLCDCVESASRTLSEPTPARIEQLVRDLSHKRLVDGQFDDSSLTFRELRQVEDSIIKSLNAIYHGRISYPSQRSESREARGDSPLPKVAS